MIKYFEAIADGPDLMELRTVKILEEIFHGRIKTLGINVIS